MYDKSAGNWCHNWNMCHTMLQKLQFTLAKLFQMRTRLNCTNLGHIKQTETIYRTLSIRQQRKFLDSAVSISQRSVMCFPWCFKARPSREKDQDSSNAFSTKSKRSRSSRASFQSITSVHSTRVDRDFSDLTGENKRQFEIRRMKIDVHKKPALQEESTEEESENAGNHFEEQYRIGPIIGSGSFGNVYACEHLENSINEPIVIKMLKKSGHQSYFRETAVLSFLNSRKASGIPTMYFYGKYNEKDVMIMTRLGTDFATLFNLCGKKFSLSTVLRLSVELLTHLQSIHNEGVIHRDIKPHNFLIGYQKDEKMKDKTFIIDFGLAKYYTTATSSGGRQHIPEATGLTPVGTARYASTWTHQGIAQSRRDDLEALGFILVYFFQGRLPWQGIPIKNRREKWSKIGYVKLNTSVDELCNGLPKQFVQYFQYVRSLTFSQEPDYESLKNLFIEAASDCGIKDLKTVRWDWKMLA